MQEIKKKKKADMWPNGRGRGRQTVSLFFASPLANCLYKYIK
jgi:hypothetical protein